MARRPNYGFEKRQKELEREKKKDAKAARKQARKEEGGRGGEDTPVEGNQERADSGAGLPEGSIA